jgi:GTP cyclohydrolase I
MDKVQYEKHVGNLKGLLTDLGEDANREGLAKTPARHLDSLMFLTSGYKEDPNKILNEAVFHEKYNDMVIVRDIEVYSVCEHHVLPFFGRCHVGYIPNGKIVGLSKIPRIVDIFSRRLQVQERLTHQVAEAMQEALNPQGVGVIVEAFHMCMMMRGVEKQKSYTMTSSMLGCFQKMETRNEFLSLIRTPTNQAF